MKTFILPLLLFQALTLSASAQIMIDAGQNSFPKGVQMTTPSDSPLFQRVDEIRFLLGHCGMRGLGVTCIDEVQGGYYQAGFNGYHRVNSRQFFYQAYHFQPTDENPGPLMYMVVVRRDTTPETPIEFYFSNESLRNADILKKKIDPDLIYKPNLDPKSLRHYVSLSHIPFTSKMAAARVLFEIEKTEENQTLLKDLGMQMVQSGEFSPFAFDILISNIKVDSDFLNQVESAYLGESSQLETSEKEFIALFLAEHSMFSAQVLDLLNSLVFGESSDPRLRLKGIELLLSSGAVDREEISNILLEIYNKNPDSYSGHTELRVSVVTILSQLPEQEGSSKLIPMIGDHSEDVRTVAVTALSDRALGPDSIPLLQSVYSKNESSSTMYREIRASVATLLGRVTDEAAAVEVLISMIDDDAELVREKTLEVLERKSLGDETIPLLQGVYSRNQSSSTMYREIRASVATLLGRVVNEAAAAEALISMIDDDAELVREKAIEILEGRSLTAEVIPLLQGVYSRNGSSSTMYREIRASVATLLARVIDEATATKALISMIDDDADSVREKALEILRERSLTAEVIPLLQGIYSRNESSSNRYREIRALVATLLGRVNDESAAVKVLISMIDDEASSVREKTLEVLEEKSLGAETIPLLESIYHQNGSSSNRYREIRATVAKLLGRVTDQGAASRKLIPMLGDESKSVRDEAETALSKIELDAEAIPALETLYNENSGHSDSEIRKKAVGLVSSVFKKEALNALIRFLAAEENKEIKALILEGIEKIQEKLGD